jgi:hypothetical protein
MPSLPSELLRHIFLFSRSPTAWLIRQEFARRAQEEADIEAHTNAAELHYSNLEYQNELAAYELYLEDERREARRASRSFL